MKEDKYISIVLIIFSGFMYFQATLLPKPMFGTLGAGFFPKILFVVSGFFSISLFIKSLISESKSSSSETDDNFIERTVSLIKYHNNVIVGFSSFLAYIVLLYYVGYLLATLVFMPFLMWYTGPKDKKSIKIIFLTTISVTFIVYFAFLKLLNVFLPSGVIF